MENNNALNSVVRRIDAALLVLGAVGLVAMMVHISADVLSGLLFNAPIAVTSAYVTQYYMIAVAFLPLAAGEFRGAHIGVDLFVKRLPEGARHGLETAVLVLCLAVYAMLAVQSWQQAMSKLASNAFMMEQTTRVSVWPSYFMLPLGFGLIGLLIAVKVVCRLMGRPEPAPPAESNEEQVLERFGDV